MIFGERQVEIPWFVKKLQAYNGRCMDVGSAGSFIEEFKRQKIDLTRVDQLEISADGFSKIIRKDVRDLSFSDVGGFDVVSLISTLEHVGLEGYGKCLSCADPVAEQRHVFNHCFSFVNAGGVLIATIPFGRFENGGWYLTYNAEMIDNLIGTKNLLEETYFTLDRDTWTYIKVPRYKCPLEGQDWPRPDFSRATSVCCLILQKIDKILYENKLNLGCGGSPINGFLNVDMLPLRDDVIKQDFINYMRRCPSNSVDDIKMSHSLEHVPYLFVDSFLQDCYRSLKSNGRLEIVCPDFKYGMQKYLTGSVSYDLIQKYFYGDHKNAFDQHLWIVDDVSLVKFVENVGFKDSVLYTGDGNIAIHCRKD